MTDAESILHRIVVLLGRPKPNWFADDGVSYNLALRLINKARDILAISGTSESPTPHDSVIAQAIAALNGMLAEWDKMTRYGSPLAKAANENVNRARATVASLRALAPAPARQIDDEALKRTITDIITQGSNDMDEPRHTTQSVLTEVAKAIDALRLDNERWQRRYENSLGGYQEFREIAAKVCDVNADAADKASFHYAGRLLRESGAFIRELPIAQWEQKLRG